MLEKTTTKSAKAPPKDKAEVARKAKKPAAAKPVPRTAVSQPAASRTHQDHMRERVQRRAYELWESEGRPAGREHDHWLQAEREIAISTWA
jgi:hypothetical protein